MTENSKLAAYSLTSTLKLSTISLYRTKKSFFKSKLSMFNMEISFTNPHGGYDYL